MNRGDWSIAHPTSELPTLELAIALVRRFGERVPTVQQLIAIGISRAHAYRIRTTYRAGMGLP